MSSFKIELAPTECLRMSWEQEPVTMKEAVFAFVQPLLGGGEVREKAIFPLWPQTRCGFLALFLQPAARAQSSVTGTPANSLPFARTKDGADRRAL